MVDENGVSQKNCSCFITQINMLLHKIRENMSLILQAENVYGQRLIGLRRLYNTQWKRFHGGSCSEDISNMLELSKKLSVLGEGGFGIVYDLNDGTVIKAIKIATDCDEAQHEFKMHFLIKKTLDLFFNKYGHLEPIKQLEKLLFVPKPLLFCEDSMKIGNRSFSCFYCMEKAWGLPLNVFQAAIPEETMTTLGKDVILYLKQHKVPIHLHVLGMYVEPEQGITTFQMVDEKSTSNTLRGYMASRDDNPVLKYLATNMGLYYTGRDVVRFLGMVHAILYYMAGILLNDVEFTVGYNPMQRQFVLNMLDFGLVTKTSDTNLSYEDVMGDDIYADAEESPSYAVEGWEIIKNMLKSNVTSTQHVIQ